MQTASEEFAGNLEYFYPAHGNNGFNERNLSFRFAKEFEKRPHSCAFMEVPYYNERLDKFNKRIDCLAIDNRMAIFIEAKRLYNSIKASELSKDLNRLDKEITSSILAKLSRREKPTHVYSLLIAETWQPSVVDWWEGRSSAISWSKDLFPESLEKKTIKVKQFEDATLFWLYAYQKIT